MLNRESQKSLNPRHPATANRRFNQLWSRYKTAESFSSEEIELFKTAKKAGYSVILFTNKEIEPYHPYYESGDKEELPHVTTHPVRRFDSGVAR